MASPPWTGSSLSHASGIMSCRLPGKPPKLASEHPRMRGVVVSETLFLVARVIRRIPTTIALDRNPVVHIGSGQFGVHASAYFLRHRRLFVPVSCNGLWNGYSGSPRLYLESFER